MNALAVLLIADDLTGACDAAVHLAMRGHRTAVSLFPRSSEPDTEPVTVLAISTDSRDFVRDEIEDLMASLAAGLPYRSSRVLFKKIDSTLRGNGGLEIAAALRAFECDAAVVTPALPAMRRVVEAGILRVDGDESFQPIDVAAWLASQGVATCPAKPGAIAEALAAGARVVSLDATCDADLDLISSELVTLPGRILWAGSAGLAAALARSLPPLDSPHWPQVALPTGNPVLFCIGSNHAVTLSQLEALASARTVTRISSPTATADEVAAALQRREHVLLDIPRGHVTSAELCRLILQAPASGLFLSGGDTASLVCRGVGAHGIHPYDEIVPGIPRGVLRGGPLNGMPVVTKSGGFGDSDALIRVADYFSCPTN